jgi:hypothetical protein
MTLVGLVYFFSLSILLALCESSILVLSYTEVSGKGLINPNRGQLSQQIKVCALSGDEPMRLILEHIVPTYCIEGTYSVSY